MSIPHTRPAAAPARRYRPGTRRPGWRCSPTTPSSRTRSGRRTFDPEGKGHRGRDAISAFWDKAIAPTAKIEFVFRDTYQCGNEEANVGHILITTGEYQTTAEGVFTYKANDEGKLVALRAYLGDGPRGGERQPVCQLGPSVPSPDATRAA